MSRRLERTTGRLGGGIVVGTAELKTGTRDEIEETGARDEVEETGTRDEVEETGTRDEVVETGTRDEVEETGIIEELDGITSREEVSRGVSIEDWLLDTVADSDVTVGVEELVALEYSDGLMELEGKRADEETRDDDVNIKEEVTGIMKLEDGTADGLMSDRVNRGIKEEENSTPIEDRSADWEDISADIEDR